MKEAAAAMGRQPSSGGLEDGREGPTGGRPEQADAVSAPVVRRSSSADNPASVSPVDAGASSRPQSYTIPAAQWRDQTGRQVALCWPVHYLVPTSSEC